MQRGQLLAPALHGPVQPERRRLLGVRVHACLLSCGAFGAAIALRALAATQLPAPRPFSGPFGQVRPQAAIGGADGVRHARCDLPTRVLRSRKSFCGALQRCGAFAWVLPIGRRCKASLLGLSADMPGRRRGAPDSRRPARAGIPTELPATSRCRPEFCGDVARAARSSASRATAPRRLSGHAASGVPRGGGGSAPLGRLGGSSHLCAGGTGGGSITPTSKVGPSRRAGRMVLWGCSGPNEEPWLRGGRSWRKAAFAGFRHRSSCSRAPLVEKRPIENSAQWDDSAWGREAVLGLGPTLRIVVGRFYYAQSDSRDLPAQYAVRSAFSNTKNCRSSQ